MSKMASWQVERRNFHERRVQINLLKYIKNTLEWRIDDRLLCEKTTSMDGIARAVSISKIWLPFHVKKIDSVRKQAFKMSRKGKVFIEDNGVWTWLAAARREGLMAGCHVGKRYYAGAAAPLISLFECTAKRTEYFSRTAWHVTQKHFRRAGAELPTKDIRIKIVGISQENTVFFEKHGDLFILIMRIFVSLITYSSPLYGLRNEDDPPLQVNLAAAWMFPEQS